MALALSTAVQAKITYTLSFSDRAEHYVTVDIEIDGLQRREFVDFKMAVWTPGSYLVRDYARNVLDFQAFAGNKQLDVAKTDKQTWRITNSRERRITVRYKVYAFEPSVRTSFVDTEIAMLNGASIFAYPDGLQNQEMLVVVSPPRTWRQTTTSLAHVGGRSPVFRAANYDELVDSPIMVGNQKIIDFMVGQVPHHYAIAGVGNYDQVDLIGDSQLLAQSIIDIFGTSPYGDYTIFLQLTDRRRNGLEHLNSTHLQYPRLNFEEGKYLGYQMLFTHELFHAFNVKRIRPEALGPFDYGNENYTTLLWVAEGFTDYYERLLPRRTGLWSEETFLTLVGENIAALESQPGRLKQSLQEASFDAWIKQYRKDENSPNSIISYYDKGRQVGMIFDLTIRAATNGEKSLDDVFRILWQGYRDSGNGFSDADLRTILESVAGIPIDDVYRYASTSDEIEWEPIFATVGLTVVRSFSDPADSSNSEFGIKYSGTTGAVKVTGIVAGASGGAGGLSARDELIAVDKFRITPSNVAHLLSTRSLTKSASFVVNRDGLIKTVKVRPVPKTPDKVTLVKVDAPTDSQKRLYEGWLNATWE